MKLIDDIILVLILSLASCTDATSRAPARWMVSTLAGSGTRGYQDGAGTAAQFNSPIGVDVDSSGNIYVADRTNNRIRMITPGGEVSTFVNSGEGGDFANVTTGTAVRFNLPTDVAVDSSDTIYVADTYNHRIQKITAGGVKSILAGSDTGESGTANGIGTAARFNSPQGVAVDLSGNVYVADYNNDRIQKITPGRGVSTLAGSGTQGSADGAAAAAQFKSPTDVVVDSSGIVYVIDSDNHRIRKIEYRVP